jgi:hypothetical protein
MNFLSIALSTVSALISGSVLFFLQRHFKRRDADDKTRSEARKQENILVLKSIKVIGELTQANSIAIRDGKTNGELKHALADYEKIDEELYEFLLEQNSVIN